MHKTINYVNLGDVAICGHCNKVHFNINKYLWKYVYFHIPGNSRRKVKTICPECKHHYQE